MSHYKRHTKLCGKAEDAHVLMKLINPRSTRAEARTCKCTRAETHAQV